MQIGKNELLSISGGAISASYITAIVRVSVRLLEEYFLVQFVKKIKKPLILIAIFLIGKQAGILLKQIINGICCY